MYSRYLNLTLPKLGTMSRIHFIHRRSHGRFISLYCISFNKVVHQLLLVRRCILISRACYPCNVKSFRVVSHISIRWIHWRMLGCTSWRCSLYTLVELFITTCTDTEARIACYSHRSLLVLLLRHLHLGHSNHGLFSCRWNMSNMSILIGPLFWWELPKIFNCTFWRFVSFLVLLSSY